MRYTRRIVFKPSWDIDILLLHKHTWIILQVYQAGWSESVKSSGQRSLKVDYPGEEPIGWGFKDVCALRFCLFSLVLSTQGQSNSFSKVSKLHNLLEICRQHKVNTSIRDPVDGIHKLRTSTHWHHAFIGKKLLDDR